MIVTFYSYKGGVGRSMALANIAVLLARRGLKVLMVDWDLEAPGIENYFSYFKVETDKPGLLTMLMDASHGKVEYKKYLSTAVGESEELSLLASGRATDINYSANLERFDWSNFFANGGGDFLESIREQWRQDFDIILVDSRTGLSDSGGICTIQMPDVLVGMFTTNHQSLYGVRDVMRLTQHARQSLAYDRAQLSIIPVCSRFGNDFRESQSWLDRTAEAMGEFYEDWLPAWAKARDIVEHLKIPHVDYFGYGEKLAVMEQGTTDPQGMGFAYEKIANLLAGNLANADEVFGLKMPTEASKPRSRRKKRAQHEETSASYEYDWYVSYAHSSVIEEAFRPFVVRLGDYVSDMLGRRASYFFDYRELAQGTGWDLALRDALSKSRLLLAITTPRYFQSKFAVAEWMTFEARENFAGGPNLIVPVFARGEPTTAPPWFLKRQFFDARDIITILPSRRTPKAEKAIISLAETIANALSMPPVSGDAPIISPDAVEIESSPLVFPTRNTS